jgi:hypothetical protein
MSLAGVYTETPTIFLQPRPLARHPGSFILLPLLPGPQPVKPLPADVWSTILAYVIDDEDDQIGTPVPERRTRSRERWRLLFVCKSWVVSVLFLTIWEGRWPWLGHSVAAPQWNTNATRL